MPNIETNVLCHEQLVMAKTWKNELEVSHDLSMVTLSQGDEFNLVEVKENEIRKRCPTYEKVFLQVFIFKGDFNFCLQIVESNEVSEIAILMHGFNCDISSNTQTDFEMILIQFSCGSLWVE